MTLKEKLKTLGFEETYSHGQYIKRDLSVYVYIKYNKIVNIQIAKVWELNDFNHYAFYLSMVYGTQCMPRIIAAANLPSLTKIASFWPFTRCQPSV